MKAYQILSYAPINDVDQDKAAKIADSIKRNGWQGAPILVMEESGVLITGSHRQAALKLLHHDADYDGSVFDVDVAEPVDDIVTAWCEANYCTLDDFPYDDLGKVFRGTWVEQYAGDIAEW